MRMTVTTFNVLKRLHEWKGFRPYNFFLLPIVAAGGWPAGVDPKHFTLVATFESDQKRWLRLPCINIAAPNDFTVYKLSTSFTSPEYGKSAVLEVLEDLLYRYPRHPEAKSLGSDGMPCGSNTRGLLQRAHIIAGRHRRIGKRERSTMGGGCRIGVIVLHSYGVQTTRKRAQCKRTGTRKRRSNQENQGNWNSRVGTLRLWTPHFGENLPTRAC